MESSHVHKGRATSLQKNVKKLSKHYHLLTPKRKMLKKYLSMHRYMCACQYRQHHWGPAILCLCLLNYTRILLKYVNKSVYSRHAVSVNCKNLPEDSTKPGQLPEF